VLLPTKLNSLCTMASSAESEIPLTKSVLRRAHLEAEQPEGEKTIKLYIPASKRLCHGNSCYTMAS